MLMDYVTFKITQKVQKKTSLNTAITENYFKNGD